MSKKHRAKEDNSPHVPQNPKFKEGLSIRELNWTEKQKAFIELALNKETKIIFVKGPAGSSKSLISVYCALKLLQDKKISDILYVRSPVESSESHLGFLPGSADEKMECYTLPFKDKLEELLPKNQIDVLEKQERICSAPVNYMRGASYNAKCLILDEAQCSSQKEIITVLTRIGKFSKCFVLGDEMQTDLPPNRAGAFVKLYNLFNDEDSKSKGVHTFEFNEDDILRSEIVKFLVKKLKTL